LDVGIFWWIPYYGAGFAFNLWELGRGEERFVGGL